MSYVKPVVQVYQEYQAYTNAAQTMRLIPCIVGPAYHVLKYDTDPILTRVGVLSDSGNSAISVPNNKPGAIIDTESIKLKFANPKAYLVEAPCTGVSEYRELTFTSGNFPSATTVGCTLTVRDIVGVGEYETLIEGVTVVAVDATNYTLSVDKAIFTTSTTLTVSVYMPLVDFYITNASGTFALEANTNPLRTSAGVLLVDRLNNSINIETNAPEGFVTYDTVAETFSVSPLVANIDNVDCPISGAVIYCQYKSLRQDLALVNTLRDYSSIEEIFGACNADNPLGLGVTLAFANTSKVPVKCIGIRTNDLEGYTEAKDRLSNESNVYSIVPLTQDPDIIQIFAEHAYEMSTPEVGLWRICFGNNELPVDKALLTGTASVRLDGASRSLLYSASGKFMTSYIVAGNTVVLRYSTQASFRYTIKNIITDDIIEVDEEIDDAFLTDGTLYSFSVEAPLTKTQQAIQIAGASESYRSRRMFNIWPDSCVVDNETVPGYYLGCVLAGLTGGLPSHQGFTRLAIGGVTEVLHCSDYFSSDQLDIIAEGGTLIVQQDNDLAVPVVRHQLSTDMSTIEFRELSFTKNYDYVAYLSKDLLDQFIGQYNITPVNLLLLKTALDSLYSSLQMAVLPKIGAPILSYNIASLTQSQLNRGRVEIVVNILFPYALNEIGLHLVSI